MCREMKLDQVLTPHTRINSKCIKYLSVRHQPIEILEKNIGSKISDIAHSNILLNIPPGQRKQKKNKQIGLHQTKKFLHSKENSQQNKKATYRMTEHITNISHRG